jgi:acyl carrier protein
MLMGEPTGSAKERGYDDTLPSQNGHTSSGIELESFLKQKLPAYMVPAIFVLLAALPLTPHGKLDRQALPPPESIHSEPEDTFVAPRSTVEEELAAIWADVLGVSQVSVHDNFFTLGGHSLLATQVISRIRETFQLELPVHCLFEAPTIAELELILVQAYAQVADSEVVNQLLAELAERAE